MNVETLVTQYHKVVKQAVNKSTGKHKEDYYQECMMHLIKKADKIDDTRNPESFIYRAVYNCIRNLDRDVDRKYVGNTCEAIPEEIYTQENDWFYQVYELLSDGAKTIARYILDTYNDHHYEMRGRAKKHFVKACKWTLDKFENCWQEITHLLNKELSYG